MFTKRLRKLIFAAPVALGLAIALLLTFDNGVIAVEKTKSTIIGTGIGALVGQAFGHDTQGTLIGGAIGAGVGYVVGNEKDKANAAQLSAKTEKQNYHHNEVGALGDTMWTLQSISPKDRAEPFFSKVVAYRNDGHVMTLTTDSQAKVTLSDEIYRVVDDTLVINKPGYIVNAKFKIAGDQLTLMADDFTAVLTRLRAE